MLYYLLNNSYSNTLQLILQSVVLNFNMIKIYFYVFIHQRLLTSMDITLIVLAVLQLYANIQFSILGIEALTGDMTKV